jgi:hypothetical protein
MSDLVEQREAAYERMMGREYSHVHHESDLAAPHVDVYVFPPTDVEEFFTLITGGMSDLPMRMPRESSSDSPRAELVMFVSEPRQELFDVLQVLAHYPHEHDTWFGWGHTIPWSKPIVPGSRLDTLLLAHSELQCADAGSGLVIEGHPVRLLQVFPITSAECELKSRQGAAALIDRFIERGLALSVDFGRESLVTDDELGDPFPFSEPPSLGVFTTAEITRDGMPVLLVAHSEDGDWQFLPGTAIEPDALSLVHLSHIVEEHPEVRELHDLPLGWAAERSSVDEPWKRYAWPDDA